MNLYRRKLEKIYKQIDKLAVKGKDNTLEYYKYIDEIIQKGDYGSFEQVLSYYYKIEISNIDNVDIVKKNTWNTILFQTTTPFLKKLSSLYKAKNVYQSSYDIYSDNPNILQIDLSQPLSTTYSNIVGYTQSFTLVRDNDIINLNIINSNLYLIQISKSDWVDGEPTNVELIQNINVGTQSIIQTEIPVSYGREYSIKTFERPDFMEINYKLDTTKDNLIGQIIEIDTYTQDIKYLLENKLYARLIGEVRYFLEVHKNGVISIVSDEDPYLSFDQNLLNRYNLALDILLA